jgi:hypothetical protein
VTKLGLLDIGEKLKGRAQLVSCVHDEIIVECDEVDAESILAEVQVIMETWSAKIFNGQKIGVETHVKDNWAGVKVPTQSTGLVLAACVRSQASGLFVARLVDILYILYVYRRRP